MDIGAQARHKGSPRLPAAGAEGARACGAFRSQAHANQVGQRSQGIPDRAQDGQTTRMAWPPRERLCGTAVLVTQRD